jgi:hypothetical protein
MRYLLRQDEILLYHHTVNSQPALHIIWPGLAATGRWIVMEVEKCVHRTRTWMRRKFTERIALGGG